MGRSPRGERGLKFYYGYRRHLLGSVVSHTGSADRNGTDKMPTAGAAINISITDLHKLTHLLHPNHNSEFYDFMTVHMPDRKERKKQLDTKVVQNL